MKAGHIVVPHGTAKQTNSDVRIARESIQSARRAIWASATGLGVKSSHSVVEECMRASLVASTIIAASILTLAQTNRVIPKGAEIKVRTDTAIPAKPKAGASFAAQVTEDVQDSAG